MALLELLNVEGDSQEESATVTETWYCEYSDVADRYALDYDMPLKFWTNFKFI